MSKKKTLKEKVFDAVGLWEDRGLTCEDIVNLYGLRHQSVSARLCELRQEEKLRIVGRKKVSSGRTARIYQVS